MKQLLGIICLSLLFLCTNAQKSPNDEVSIYNSLLDSMYTLNTCFKIVYPPYYKCCDIDSLHETEEIECCEQSKIPKEYRVYCGMCFNKADYDSLNVYMITTEELLDIKLTKDEKKYVLNKLERKSPYYQLIKQADNLSKIHLAVSKLKQGNIQFITQKDYELKSKSHRYGKWGKEILLGYFELSRIKFDSSGERGFFIMNWVGGGTCGYRQIKLINFSERKWKIVKTIGLGVY